MSRLHSLLKLHLKDKQHGSESPDGWLSRGFLWKWVREFCQFASYIPKFALNNCIKQVMKYTLVVSESQDTIVNEFQRIIGSLPVKSSIPYMKLHLPLVASRHQALGFEAWRAAVREHRKVTHDKWGKDHGRNHGKHLMHPFSPVYSGYSNSRYKHIDKLTWHSIYITNLASFKCWNLFFPTKAPKILLWDDWSSHKAAISQLQSGKPKGCWVSRGEVLWVVVETKVGDSWRCVMV